MARHEPTTWTEPSYAPPATQRTNKMAIWSLILSIVWLGGLGSLAGIFMGISARRRIAWTGERGAGLASAGI
jgi:VIT1/CCC1 family predicted Fe2+/Mn2+ transporter